MKICVAGQGAFGQKHLDALKRIPGVEVTSLVGGNQDSTAQVAKKYGIPHFTGDLSEGIKRADAVILTTPTKMHFRQGEQVMRAGKHVLVEIPVTDSVEDAENLVKIAKETGVTAMGGHVRRFNPSHQYVHKKIKAGEKVMAFDAKNSRNAALANAKVKATAITKKQKIVKINDLRITPLHKVVLSTGRAVEAGKIKVGDKILRADGMVEVVKTVETDLEPITVYNLVLDNKSDGYIAGGVRVMSYPTPKGLDGQVAKNKGAARDPASKKHKK